jgi:hypothetical protein
LTDSQFCSQVGIGRKFSQTTFYTLGVKLRIFSLSALNGVLENVQNYYDRPEGTKKENKN